MNRYNVWVNIEEVNEDGDFTGKSGADFGVLPDPLGKYDTPEEAIARQGEVNSIFGSDPEHSDARPEKIDKRLITVVACKGGYLEGYWYSQGHAEESIVADPLKAKDFSDKPDDLKRALEWFKAEGAKAERYEVAIKAVQYLDGDKEKAEFTEVKKV